MPINACRLATIALEVLRERPDDTFALNFAPDTDAEELASVERAVRAAATGAGLLIGTLLRHESNAQRLIVTRLDHRARPGQRHQMPVIR